MNRSRQVLTVMLLDISPHNRAILEFFIAGSGREYFSLTENISEADGFITDYDFLGAADRWNDKYAASGKPLIVLAIKNPEISHAVWVKKPITSMSLINASDEVLRLLSDPSPHLPTNSQNADVGISERLGLSEPDTEKRTIPVKRAASGVSLIEKVDNSVYSPPEVEENFSHDHNNSDELVDSVYNDKSQVDDEVQRRNVHFSEDENDPRWKQLLGDEDVFTPAELVKIDRDRFLADNYLLGSLVSAVRLSRKTRQTVFIEIDEKRILIDVPNDRVISDYALKSEEYLRLCRTKLAIGQLNMTIPPPEVLENLLEQLEFQQLDELDNPESWLWSSAVMTGEQAIPKDIKVKQNIGVKSWPNFTRLEVFPDAMRLSAYWHNRSTTLIQATKDLDVSPARVVAFVNGVYALDLIEFDTKKLKNKERRKTNENRGLISRLFSRLLRGGRKG